MERVTVEDLQENFDEIFDRVEDGESFLISVNGKDLAVIIPYDEYTELMEDTQVDYE